MTEKFTNLYAVDGLCHNSEAGTMNHECGKPATWLGVMKGRLHAYGFCTTCKENGREARLAVDWIEIKKNAS